MTVLKDGMVRLAALVLLAAPALAGAQTLDMRGTAGAEASSDARPTRGMTQDSVESKFGSPVEKAAAVGEPPITRWDYPDFIVFFEYDRVIHAVIRR